MRDSLRGNRSTILKFPNAARRGHWNARSGARVDAGVLRLPRDASHAIEPWPSTGMRGCGVRGRSLVLDALRRTSAAAVIFRAGDFGTADWVPKRGETDPGL